MFFHHVNVGSHHLYKSLQWDKVYHSNYVSIQKFLKNAFIDGMITLTSNLSILLYICLISSDFCWIWGRFSFTIWDVSLRIYWFGKKNSWYEWRTVQGHKLHKHPVDDGDKQKWDYHIQHSNKLVYSGQHFLQTLLQTQDLGEISQITT